MNQEIVSRRKKIRLLFKQLRDRGWFVKECFAEIAVVFKLSPRYVENIVYRTGRNMGAGDEKKI